MNIFKTSVLIGAVLASMGLTAACSSDDSGDDDDDNAGTGGTTSTGGTTGTGGSSGSGGTGNTSCTMGGNTKLIPNDTGWVDKTDLCNDVGVQGAWYPYGDQYGTGNGAKKCLTWGNHMPSECAQITTPDPNVMAFPNVGGEMHTAGTAEVVLPCIEGSKAATTPTSGCDPLPGHDYASMWGAGIGFDLNAHKGPPEGDGMKETWNPMMYNVVGIRFTIVGAPSALRVEFPMLLTADEAARDVPPVTATPPTTDDHSAGAPYWKAQKLGDGKYPASPVVEGVNTVLWTEVEVPKLTAYTFDPARILGIQWHVPTGSTALNYDFTIKDVTFIRDPSM